MSTARNFRPTWVEIDLGAFGRNIDAVVRRLPERSRLIAVLKADAYGHGAVELAKHCRPDRVATIATALLEEALELRSAGIELPLLILGPLTETQIPVVLDHRITIGVVAPEELESICGIARERDVTIHLKLDSGMGRMGIIESELARVVEMIRSAPRLRIEAIYTHLANAGDPDDRYSEQQIARFDRMCEELRRAGIEAPRHHLANSAAVERGMVRPGDYVRVGIALYGAEPLDAGGSRLEPLLRWRTEIARLKELPAGSGIGYGVTFRTSRPSRIATLAVGYADGYSRSLSNNADVLVGGRRVPLVGRVSMDLVTIDVTDVAGVRIGDEAVLLGRQGREEVAAEELASRTGTISYEVFCRISRRVPRIYR